MSGTRNIDAGWIQLHSGYRGNARARGISFQLTAAELRSIASQHCVYCGAAPRLDLSFYQGRKNAIQKLGTKSKDPTNYILYRTGVDRVDNTLGYSLNNCVACCSTCNLAKRELSVPEFKDWITSVYKNFVLT